MDIFGSFAAENIHFSEISPEEVGVGKQDCCDSTEPQQPCFLVKF
jgi:hypothetical protein